MGQGTENELTDFGVHSIVEFMMQNKIGLFGKELFILFAASAFRKLSSIYVFSYFPFGFEGRIWDLIVSVPDHCLSFYFAELNCWLDFFLYCSFFCQIT